MLHTTLSLFMYTIQEGISNIILYNIKYKYMKYYIIKAHMCTKHTHAYNNNIYYVCSYSNILAS